MVIISKLITVGISIVILAIIKGFLIWGVYYRDKKLRRKHDKLQAEYMKENPDSYGIGEYRS